MPSPFPGMDPYLEHPGVWPGLHHRLINEAAALLQEQLNARGYYVEIGERVWLSAPQRSIYPDIVTVHVPASGGKQEATALVADEPIRVKRSEFEVREPYLEIYDAERNALVAGIEVLSPTNKAPGEGRRLYERKQQELREAGVHLVEIDLLRHGEHLVDLPEWVLETALRYDYLANVARVGAEDYEFYAIRIRDWLPKVGVPLKSKEADGVLDLQAVFTQAYARGPYRLRVDYSRDPEPPLADDDAAWADQILREKGLRS